VILVKLRKKLVIFSISYFTLSVLLLGYLLNLSIVKGYNQLETKQFNWEIERVITGTQQLIRSQEILVKDWSKWTDAYEYVHGQNPDFATDNVDGIFFEDQQLDYVCFFDASDQIVYAKEYDHTTKVLNDLDPKLAMSFLEFKDQSNLIQLGGQPVAFSAYQVTDSEGLKEHEGLFVFAFVLRDKHFETLSSELKENIILSDLRAEQAVVTEQIEIKSSENQSVAEYYMPYANEKLAVKIEIYLENDVRKLGQKMIRNASLLFVGIFIILNFIMYLGVKHSVVRILKISEDVSKISHSRDLNRRLDIKGKDELGMLRDDINFMLNKIEHMNRQLTEYATFDLLTGILNRRSGLERLEKLIAASNENNFELTICYIDINDLKLVNDELGHTYGDQLITDITECISRCIRSTDSFCRLGGDEFLIIFPYCNEKQSHEMLLRLREDLEHFNLTGHRPYQLSISAGILEYDGQMTIDEFLEVCDSKMYVDKKQIKAMKNSDIKNHL